MSEEFKVNGIPGLQIADLKSLALLSILNENSNPPGDR
jgi:hypothetical protein